MMHQMRTTIDLPDDLHDQARSLARDTGMTLSQTVVSLLRRALSGGTAAEVSRDPATGLPAIRVGRPVTSEDVRRLEDDE